MPVEMARKTGAGGFPQIQADVVALRPEQAIEDSDHPADRLDRFQKVRARQFGQQASMNSRRNQDMTIVIRKSIQDNNRTGTAPHDQVGSVIRLSQAATEEARRLYPAFRGGTLNVLSPPGGPNPLQHGSRLPIQQKVFLPP